MDKLKRTRSMHFVMAEPEHQALMALVAQDARRPSELMRELVRRECERRGLWPPQGEKQEVCQHA